MDRFQELRVFIAVADSGGLARAAKVIHSSPPAVTRSLAALEARLGVRLFERTTRSLRLTELGRRFLEDARRVLGDLESAEQELAGQSKVPSGHLTVTASLAFGRSVLQDVVMDFIDAHPRITVSLLLLDRLVDLVDEGFDLAVRIGSLPDSSLIALPVGTVHRLLVASPAYLARRGTPMAPEELRLHSIIAHSTLLANNEWRYIKAGKPARIALPARLEMNDAHACIAAAERGKGITIALSYMVRDAIADGRLAVVLADATPPSLPVQLLHAQRRGMAPKLRAFIDFAAPRVRAALAAGGAP